MVEPTTGASDSRGDKGFDAVPPGVWDEATAEKYVEEHGEHASNRLTVELANLLPNDYVLDIGCGSGSAIRHAALVLTEGKAVGVDSSPAMIRIAKDKTRAFEAKDRIEFRDGDAKRLPAASEAFTIAWAINSMHHWGDVGRGLDEVLRVLRSGGRLLVVEEATSEGKCAHGEGRLADPEYLVMKIAEAGFDDVSVKHHQDGELRLLVIAAKAPVDEE